MKAILIDVTARMISTVEYTGAEDLRKLVGGWLEIGRAWPNEDVLYVDEEGLMKQTPGFFMIVGNAQPLAGNGVIVGRERFDDEGLYLGTDDPRIMLAQVAVMVRFL
jgi:uncharacterized protein DUF3846